MIPIFSFLPPVIAHRGAQASAPENTLAAVRAAREEGASWVELDVKLTHDGVPILMHDETLDRTTNGTGPVAETSWDAVQTLDAGAWYGSRFVGEKVPHLAEAAKAVQESGLRMILELKPCPGRAKATAMVALIEMAKNWPSDLTSLPVVSSYDPECLAVSAQLLPHWPRGLFMREWCDDKVETARKTGLSLIGVEQEHLTEFRVRASARTRLPLVAYGVNDPRRARELLAWGVSAVFSERPREVIESFSSRAISVGHKGKEFVL